MTGDELIRVLSFTVALLFSAFALAQSQPQLASTLPSIPPVNGILGAQRHGGGAGAARRAHRRRDPRPRRQRRRCRGGGRLRHGGDLSARRQSRRRRLHGHPSRQMATATRHRLSRDRAGGGDVDHVPRRAGQCRSAEVARLGPRRRRARHRRGPGAGRSEIRLGQIHARRSDRAGDRSGRERLSGPRTISPIRSFRRRARLARWPSTASIFLNGGDAAARGRPPAAIRSRRYLARHRRTGAGRLL